MRRLIVISLFFAVVAGGPVSAQADPFSPAAVLAFADWLFARKEYERAAGEYYRYFYSAEDAKKAEILKRIGRCYQRAGFYRKAIGVLERLIQDYPSSPLVEDAYYDAAYALFKLGEYRSASGLIESFETQATLLPPFLLLDGAALLLAGEWEQAAPVLNRYILMDTALDRVMALELLGLTEEIKNVPTVSPVLAGLFSGIIPGSGKLYAGRVEDGIYSFILCGLFGGLATYAFINDGVESIPGWIYVSLGGVFYLGDIWGSVIAALQFNDEQKESVRRKVAVRIHELFP